MITEIENYDYAKIITQIKERLIRKSVKIPKG